ncbi:MAG: PaRep2b protein, partial [Pyrobaculum sp.]|nr:PaRep2b protein [Pyrobaculum sp.]
LKPHLEVDVKKAEELAEAGYRRFSDYSDANMGTKAYATLLSIARGGTYGHVAMLLMEEGALADIVLLTPRSAYNKADRIAERHGESVDPSRSPKGAVDWEDRATSVLLRFLAGYGEADLRFRLVEKSGRKGFQMFRTFGGIEALVGELWIGKVAYFNASEEELRRRVEEAKRTAPDLSGMDKAPQYLAWRATDVSTVKKLIVAATAHSWQLRWYFSLLGEEKSFSGKANVTKEGVKLIATMYWPREREDQVLKESSWLKSLLGRRVESWRELVDAIDWSWVLERVRELADELKPWIGREDTSDVERGGLVRRMLGELELLVHFAEARRGMDDDRWREERVRRLARAVETMSGRRIAGDDAKELAELIISYAERREERMKERINNLAEKVGVSREEVWSVVEFVLSDMYCLARDCARDEVVRKFVEPALELIMLDKALRGEFDRKKALLIFGEMYATAVAGDGAVGPDEVMLAVGEELGGGAALLRLATLRRLNRLQPDELKFGVRVYVEEGTYRITATGENAARFKRLLAVTAPSAGGGYLSPKFEEFVKETRVEVRLDKDSIRLTERGLVAADLTISEAGVAIKFNVYLQNDIRLQFRSTDRSRVELAARLLRLAGVIAEVGKVGDSEWHVRATTNKLAAGHKELRNAIANIVRKAMENGWVDAGKAEGWLEKLEGGLALIEGWPRYHVGLARSGALVIRYRSPNLDSIEREVQRFRDMGLVEGRHFSVETPGEGRDGYVYIRREGLEHAAWLSVHGSGRQRELAADFVKYILERAEEAGDDVYRKAEEIVKEGKARGSLTLKGFEKRIEVEGKEHVVKVIDGGAELEKSKGGKTLLRIRITAEVDGVKSDYVMTYGRYGKLNAAMGRAYARADVPGGREADAERFSALMEALTGKRPRVYRTKDGSIIIDCGREHLDGFMRYAELADTVEKWLDETSQ